MALTTEQTDLLTQTAAGTPAGELLRRYWHPLAVAEDLTDERPIRPLRVLSENLVLYRNKRGQVGLMQERCTHHGVLLYQGTVEEDSLVCPLHHWRFDVEGNCFVIAYREKIYPINWANATAYPVQEWAGLFWAYLGPLPAPDLPRYEALARDDGRRRITIYPEIDQNWFAAADGLANGHAAPTPTVLCLRMPVDDTHTWQVAVEFVAGSNGTAESSADPEIVHLDPEGETAKDGRPTAPSSFIPYWAKKEEAVPISEEAMESVRALLAQAAACLGSDGSLVYPRAEIIHPR